VFLIGQRQEGLIVSWEMSTAHNNGTLVRFGTSAIAVIDKTIEHVAQMELSRMTYAAQLARSDDAISQELY
jgi:hypothetical protein